MKILKLAVLIIMLTVGIEARAGEPTKNIEVCGDNQLIFGTGDEKGTYAAMYRNIKTVCPEVCEYKDDSGVPSAGGFMNANLLTKRVIDIGMVPEDVLELSKRTDPLVGKKVRVLGSLHINTLHIIVSKNGKNLVSGGYKVAGIDTGLGKKTNTIYIRDLADLKGQKVAVFSSALVTMTLANERLGYDIELIEVTKKEEGFAMLDANQVAAFMTTGGWPISWIDKADPKKYTLANVSDQDIKKLGAPFYPVSLNYQTLGAFGISTFGARNVIATWDYSSPSRVKQLQDFKECVSSSLEDIKELRGSHPSWVDVEDFSGENVTWLKYERTVPAN